MPCIYIYIFFFPEHCANLELTVKQNTLRGLCSFQHCVVKLEVRLKFRLRDVINIVIQW